MGLRKQGRAAPLEALAPAAGAAAPALTRLATAALPVTLLAEPVARRRTHARALRTGVQPTRSPITRRGRPTPPAIGGETCECLAESFGRHKLPPAARPILVTLQDSKAGSRLRRARVDRSPRPQRVSALLALAATAATCVDSRTSAVRPCGTCAAARATAGWSTARATTTIFSATGSRRAIAHVGVRTPNMPPVHALPASCAKARPRKQRVSHERRLRGLVVRRESASFSDLDPSDRSAGQRRHHFLRDETER